MTTENIRTYDVIVIGAGPVGENVADRTTAAGLSTVLVESELAGGECSYWACEPSKALLRPALLRADAMHVPGLDPGVKNPLDVEAVLAHRNRMSTDWNDEGQVEWIKSAGIDLLRGHGRLAGEREVSVETPEGDTVRLRARHAVAVCTGSRADLPPLPEIENLRPWTSREATSAQQPPRRLVIVGAGVVGVEMATAWQALGSRVSLLARGTGCCPGWSPSRASWSPSACGRPVRTYGSASPSSARRGWTTERSVSLCRTAVRSPPTRSSSPPAAPRVRRTSGSTPWD